MDKSSKSACTGARIQTSASELRGCRCMFCSNCVQCPLLMCTTDCPVGWHQHLEGQAICVGMFLAGANARGAQFRVCGLIAQLYFLHPHQDASPGNIRAGLRAHGAGIAQRGSTPRILRSQIALVLLSCALTASLLAASPACTQSLRQPTQSQLHTFWSPSCRLPRGKKPDYHLSMRAMCDLWWWHY